MEAHNGESCLQGHWKDGVCVCEQGFITVFSDSVFHPLYCDHEASKYTEEEPLDSRSILTVAFATYGIIALVVFFHWLWSLQSLNKSIRGMRQTVYEVISQQVRRDDGMTLHNELWDPPSDQFKCVNDSTSKDKVKVTLHARVLYKYKALEKDELSLRKCGDIITEVVQLDNGWCKGKLAAQVGFFPAAYVELNESAESVDL